jgi:hypothetical protein
LKANEIASNKIEEIHKIVGFWKFFLLTSFNFKNINYI